VQLGIHRIGDAIGAELANAGANYFGGVCINLLRHPGWGRAQETYGEEPYLVGQLGSALTRGAQNHVMACVKHFALNSMENARFVVDVTADERALHEVYLPHFKRVVRSGVASVMSAYNSVNGEWCGENATLLNTVLRDEWGFDGFVISDFLFGLRDSVKSVQAGLDIEMPFRQQRNIHLAGAVADGTLSETDVDRAVVNIVATLLRFAPTFRREPVPARVLSRAHRQLAREAATASMVLLRNDGVLPLNRASLTKVAVLGRLAAIANLGDHGSSNVIAPDPVTLLDGLRAALPNVNVVHHETDVTEIDDADADVVVVVVGFTFAEEGEFVSPAGAGPSLKDIFPERTPADEAAMQAMMERPGAQTRSREGFAPGGDRATLGLSSDDEALIADACARHDRVVVVVMSGSAVTMSSWDTNVSAVVMSWYPGIEGGHALADLLLGDADFTGRLPFVVPVDEADLPHWDINATTEVYDLFHGHALLRRKGVEPAYPFGFGLSYGTIGLLSAQMSDAETVSCRVTNSGDRNTSTVIQVYGGVPDSQFDRIERRLVGFACIDVLAGATTSVDLEVDLSILDIRKNGTWITEPLPVHLWVGQYAYDPQSVELVVQ
jgi:beta-glucosidase